MKDLRHDALGWIDGELARDNERGLARALETHDGPQQVRLHIDGRELLNFGSNDYLGLAADRRLAEAAADALARLGSGSGASPLVTGHGDAHRRLERTIAEFEGTEAALAFSSGYAANLGTIAALVGPADAIYSDQRNHASMIDGCRLSRAEVHVYPHGDAAALAEQLAAGAAYRRRLIVTESIFSMDGDRAPLVELAELAERCGAMLLVDEAHATGVLGPRGRGLAEALGVEEAIDVRIGTLSKALGAAGGFVCGRRALVEWLVNRARPYVFSTALPPATCAAACAALPMARDAAEARQRLAAQAAALARRLAAQGWRVGGESQIVPLVVGSAAEAVRLARALRGHGLLVPAIRPPSVPEGRSLLRISLTAAHTPAMVDELCRALGALQGEFSAAKVNA
jgi:8-amino-7-oxononanoate synthase